MIEIMQEFTFDAAHRLDAGAPENRRIHGHSFYAEVTLRRQAALPPSPDAARLESVANPHADSDYVVRFTAPEFTTLCPITGQPDFAHFVVDYCPAKSLVESKSLKLFLASFRNQAAFHEDC